MTAPKRAIDSRSRPSVRIRPATSAAGTPAAPASARMEPTIAALPCRWKTTTGSATMTMPQPTLSVENAMAIQRSVRLVTT